MSLINLLLFGYIRKREGLRESLFVLRYNFHKESNLARARYTTTLVAVFQVVLMSLPLVYLLCYIGQYTCCTKRCIENKLNTITSPTGHNNNDDDDDDELPPRLLPEFSESYNTFNNSD